MTMLWHKAWHGTARNPAWLYIARRANIIPGLVSAFFAALYEHASQSEDRGSVADFEIDIYADWAGAEEGQLERVFELLKDRGFVTHDNRIANWEEDQKNDSKEKVRAHRERKKTEELSQIENNPIKSIPRNQCNRLDRDRDIDLEGLVVIRTSEPKGSSVRCEPAQKSKSESKASAYPGGKVRAEKVLDQIADVWNAFASNHRLPGVQKLTEERSKLLQKRLEDLRGFKLGDEPVEAFQAALSICSRSFFIRGSPKTPLTFDQLMDESFFVKMLEGNFEFVNKPNVGNYQYNNKNNVLNYRRVA